MSTEFNFLSDDTLKRIRDDKIKGLMSGLTEKLSDLNIEVKTEHKQVNVPSAEPRYTGLQLADIARDIYKTNIKEQDAIEEKPEEEVAVSTPAIRYNARALARSLVGLRNGGDAGRASLPAGPNGGNTGHAIPATITIATMSTEEYEEYIDNLFMPEEVQHQEEETEQEFLTEDGHIEKLENELLEMSDISWTSIDKVMRVIAKEHAMTPKQLHKDFKAKHGMIPDDWAKMHEEVEQVGWYPLDEMVRINSIGQVYEVTFMFRGGRQRLKFFWPEVGYPNHNEMEEACRKFWPGARLLAYYPSHDDNMHNTMVVLPAMKENYEIIDSDIWDFMSEEDTEIYDEIAAEEGEPVTPVFLSEEGYYEMDIEDHDTGEIRSVVFGESLHDWFNKSKSKDGKPGWVQSDGSPCANEKGETKTPKCYSSRRLAGLKKTEEGRKKIRSADARKSRQDPGQQSKSGGAKPTNVRTFTDKKDYKKHPSGDGTQKEEFEMVDEGKKDACYHKVKASASVWPSAYASGRLVQCRKKGASNYGKSKKNEEFEPVNEGGEIQGADIAKKKEQGAPVGQAKAKQKRIGAKKRPKPVESLYQRGVIWEDDMKGMTVKSGHKRSAESGAGLTQKGVEAYRRKNPGSKLKTAVTTPPSKLKPGSKAAGRRKSFCARSRGWTGERGKAARRRWNC